MLVLFQLSSASCLRTKRPSNCDTTRDIRVVTTLLPLSASPLFFYSSCLVLSDNTYQHKPPPHGSCTSTPSFPCLHLVFLCVLTSSLFNHHHLHLRNRFTKHRYCRYVARMYIGQPSCLSRRASRLIKSSYSLMRFLACVFSSSW